MLKNKPIWHRNNKATPMHLTLSCYFSQSFWSLFPKKIKRCQFWVLIENVQFCQIRQLLRFDLKSNDAYFGKFLSRAQHRALCVYFSLYPFRDRPKIPKLLTIFTSRFSKSYLSITKSLNSSIKFSSNTSSLEENFSREKWWTWIFAMESR